MNKQQSGFTLIELIMVIVILGILSAFALPRFADLGGDAQTASMEAARGSVKSASAIVHAAALAKGSPATVDLEGQTITIVNGYPNAAGICIASGVNEDFDCDTTTTSGTAAISPTGADGEECFNYTEAASSASPTISTSLGSLASGVCS